MSKHLHVHLTTAHRAPLAGLIQAGNAPARTPTRARSLLLTDRPPPHRLTDAASAAARLCTKQTVGNVRRRCVQQGLAAALDDRPRPGVQPKITGAVEAQLTRLACRAPPDGQARWTLHRVADNLVELGCVERLSAVAVLHRLKKTTASPGA